jgi:hypothetical protein
MGEMAFLFYLSIPVLTLGFGYYWFTDRRRNKLFNEFEKLRSETYKIEDMEQFLELETRVMSWSDKLRLPSETAWRGELFGLMRDTKSYLKEKK